MSTKIYNGYALPLMSLEELTTKCSEFRDLITNPIKQIYKELYVKLLVSALDHHCAGLEKIKTDTIFITVSDFLFKEFKKSDEGYRSYVDASFSFTLFPMKDKILAMVFSEQDTLTKIFIDYFNAQSYCYYNNTDKPEEVSDLEWEQRKDDWDSVLKNYYIPALNGFHVECHNRIYHNDWTSISNNDFNTIMNFDDRVKTIAVIMIENTFLSENSLEKIEPQNAVRYLQILREYKKTAKYEIELDEKKKEVENMLIKKLTRSMFFDKISELVVFNTVDKSGK